MRYPILRLSPEPGNDMEQGQSVGSGGMTSAAAALPSYLAAGTTLCALMVGDGSLGLERGGSLVLATGPFVMQKLSEASVGALGAD
jgi:hypothetical protein